MRTFSCYYFQVNKFGDLVLNENTTCWNGLNYDEANLKQETKSIIYIKDYIEKEIDDRQRRRMVKLINMITPCKFVVKNDIKLIMYKRIGYYYADLVLLNFLRMMWYMPENIDFKGFWERIMKLKKNDEDVLVFLLKCIKDNIVETTAYGYGNHSFVYQDIVPKPKQRLLDYKAGSMQNFLQQK